MSEIKESYTTVLEGQIHHPAYKDDGERVNFLADARVNVLGTATLVDLLLIIISIYSYIDQYFDVPPEKVKAGVEQIERLLSEIKLEKEVNENTP